MEDNFLYLVVTLSAALGLALLTVGIIFLSNRFQASVPRRGGACPWSNQQTILFALFLADLLLAYVFVQWYDWENDVLHLIQVVLLGIVVVLIGWLEFSDPRCVCLHLSLISWCTHAACGDVLRSPFTFFLLSMLVCMHVLNVT